MLSFSVINGGHYSCKSELVRMVAMTMKEKYNELTTAVKRDEGMDKINTKSETGKDNGIPFPTLSIDVKKSQVYRIAD